MDKKLISNRGQLCETIAQDFFENQGYQVIFKNHKIAKIEIDLILKKNNQYLLVEVKSNNKWRKEYPISQKQKKRLFMAFSYFCDQHEEPTQVKLAIVETYKKIYIFDLEF